ncbi:hypothetical protein FA95DRAFT_1680249 [Auriscalpium vulgare]|uniref:Uncharacterized protein n=1 Tax=Auriscalpium vulgare TaxID=40419 RepID=A0ACB8RQI0_9AGAM|nr:hypothetical protein FA95DRAFT_1680249 [Auriscalpium vulgare]
MANANKTGQAPGKKPSKAQTSKTKAKAAAPAPETQEAAEPADTTIDWSTELTWQLVSAIEDEPDAKRGLFPPKGKNPRKSGGNTKAHWHDVLAKNLFEDHLVYGAAYERASSKDEKAAWATKIKNRLTALTKTTNKYTEEMGRTGAGLTEAEIDMSLDNEFVNKWRRIKEDFPWYFNMRDLIADRPNQVPVGLGHSGTDVDASVLQPSDLPEDDGTTPASGMSTNEGAVSESQAAGEGGGHYGGDDGGDLGDDNNNDNEEAGEPSAVRAKRKAPADDDDLSDEDLPRTISQLTRAPRAATAPAAPASEKTPARAGASKPAVTPKPAASDAAKKSSEKRKEPVKKKNKTSEFIEAAKAEETTLQTQVELAKAKVTRDMETVKSKTQFKLKLLEYKTQKLQARADLTKLKLEQEHAYRMAHGGHSSASSGFGSLMQPYGGMQTPGVGSSSQGSFDTNPTIATFQFDASGDQFAGGELGDGTFGQMNDP